MIHWRLVTRTNDYPNIAHLSVGEEVNLLCRIIDSGPLEDGDHEVTLEIMDLE